MKTQINNNFCKVKNEDKIIRRTKFVLYSLIVCLLLILSICSGFVLGNTNAIEAISNLENLDVASENADTDFAEAASGDSTTARGVSSAVISISAMGTTYPTFSSSNSYATRYSSNQSQGLSHNLGSRLLGSSQTDKTKKSTMTNKASATFKFTGTAGSLARAGLLKVTFYAYGYANCSYNQIINIIYRRSTGTSCVGINSSQVDSGWASIGRWDVSDKKNLGGKSVTYTTGTEEYLSIGITAYASSGKWAWDYRSPASYMKNIYISLTNLDTTKCYFDMPTYSSWVYNERSTYFVAKDNISVSSMHYRSNVSGYTGSASSSGTSKNITFTATPNYNYYVRAIDTNSNVSYADKTKYSTDNTTTCYRTDETTNHGYWFNYIDFKIDAVAPEILSVVYVKSGSTSTTVQNNSGTGSSYNGSVYCYIHVRDYSYGTDKTYTSGIKNVYYGSTSCTIVPAGTNIGGTSAVYSTCKDGYVSEGWYKYPNAIDANQTGEIKVYDRCTDSSHSNGHITTRTSTLTYLDAVAPTVTVNNIVLNGLSINNNFDKWNQTDGIAANNYIEFIVKDRATGGSAAARNSAAGISYAYTTFEQYSITNNNVMGNYTIRSGNFNPNTGTYSSQKNIDASSTSIIYKVGSRVEVTEGGNYYYQYTIRVPLLYGSNYSFYFTDLAGNKTNASVNSSTVYRPKIDQSAPVIGDTTAVYGYVDGTSLGLALSSNKYLPANKLVFKVSSNDAWEEGRNDGSGIKKIEIFKTDSSGNKTGTAIATKDNLSYNNPPAGGTELTVDASSVGGLQYLNSNYNSKYWIVVTDGAGNTSDMATTHYMDYNSINNVYKRYQVYVDNIVPIVQIVSTANVALNPYPVDETYDSKDYSSVYEYNWTNTSKSYKLKITYGCSGAKVFKYSDGLDESDKIKLDPEYSVVYSTNSNDYNKTISQTANATGIHYYSYGIVSNAGLDSKAYGNDQSKWIVLKVKIDKIAPSYQLLGFGAEECNVNATSLNSIKTSIAKPSDLATGKTLDEASLTTEGQYYGSKIYAYYYIYDTTGGGSDDKINTSWLSTNNLTSSEETQTSKAKPTINTSYNGYIYSSDDDNNINMISYIYGSTYTIMKVRLFELDDLKKMNKGATSFYANGVYDIVYNQNVIYNISFCDAVGNVAEVKCAGDRNLNYNVDPFPIDNSHLDEISYTSEDNVTYNGYNGDWTSAALNYKLSKQMTISGVSSYYIIKDAKEVDGVLQAAVPLREEKEGVGSVSSSIVEFSLIIGTGSRCGYIYFQFEKSSCTLQTPGSRLVTVGVDNYIVRQDKQPPAVSTIFFSHSADLGAEAIGSYATNNDILAYFEKTTDTNYKFNRMTTNTTLWTYESVYMYVVASDRSSVGAGSGIKTVSLKNQNGNIVATKLNASNVNTNNDDLYCSTVNSFGYNTATNTNGFGFKLTDNQLNVTDEIVLDIDTNGNCILPRIDNGQLYLNLESATYKDKDGNDASYLNIDNKLSGLPSKDAVVIKLKYRYGKSGAKLYWISVSENYNKTYDNNPWGYAADFIGSTMSSDIQKINNVTLNSMNTTGLAFIYTPDKDNEITFTITNDTETKSRYYFFIASNINEYCDGNDINTAIGERVFSYVAAGDVLIDNAPPKIDSVTYVSKATGKVIGINDPYSKTYSIGDYFTNDSVYAYYKVSDGASGIKELTTLNDKAGDPIYISTGIYAGTYMLEMKEKLKYQIKVVDNSTNECISAIFEPNIDKTVPNFVVSTKLIDNITPYNSTKTDNNFTNSTYINVTLEADYGASGLGSIMFKTTDTGDWQNISEFRDMYNNVISFVENESKTFQQATFKINKTSVYWFMCTNKINELYAIGGIVPNSLDQAGQGKYMRIAIDTESPYIVNGDNTLFNNIATKWHKNPQVLVLEAFDKGNDSAEIGGSGVKEIKMSYKINGETQTSVYFEYVDGNYIPKVDGNNFALSLYTTYTILIKDKAENLNTYTIKPALDTNTPEWSLDSNNKLFTLTSGSSIGPVYEAGKWTSENVFVNFNPKYFISGAKIQYSINNGAWTDCGDNYKWNALDTTDSNGKVKNCSFEIKPEGTNDSLNKSYKFRILSNSVNNVIVNNAIVENINASADLEIGTIMIDKAAPVFFTDKYTTFKKDNINKEVTIDSSETALTADITFWCQDNFKVAIKTYSVLASGAHAEYCFKGTNGDYKEWSTISLSYNNNTYEGSYIIKGSMADGDCKFRIVSGSNLMSKELIVNDIKIDAVMPDFTPLSRATSNGLDMVGEKFAEVEKSVFDNASLHNFTEYTNEKYIILSIQITSMGFSGADIIIKREGLESEVYKHIDYLNYKNKIDNGEDVIIYYSIPVSGDIQISLKSQAEKSKDKTKTFLIDNTLPELYIKSIESTSSSNSWDENHIDTCWYTGPVDFNFGVGIYKIDGDSLVREDKAPIDGYKIYYNNSSWDSERWETVNNTAKFTIDGTTIINSIIYRFKIVSISGVENELGKGIVYNRIDKNGNVILVAAADSNKVKKQICEDHTDAVINHLCNNNDNADDYFKYLINYDGNEYSCTTTQTINYNPDNINTDSVTKATYGKYVYEKYEKGEEGEEGDYKVVEDINEFKHGDLVRVTYVANYGLKYGDDNGYYKHRYTEIYEDYVNAEKTTVGSDTNLDTGGNFTFTFGQKDFVIDAYYNVELKVTYSNTEVFLQNYRDNENATYKPNTNVLFNGSPLFVNLTYTNMDNNTEIKENGYINPNIFEVGGYLLTVNFDEDSLNSKSFTLTNPSDVLIVKYFKTDITTSKFLINDEYDWNFIASSYYDKPIDGSLVLGEAKTYLDSDYVQTKDITIASTSNIKSDFKGNYNGSNYTITCIDEEIINSDEGIINIVGDYGLFGKLEGSVHNVNIQINQDLVVNYIGTSGQNGNVGIVASESNGGKIYNVRVNANIIIKNTNSNANIGGLVGLADNSELGIEGANTIVVDIDYNSEKLHNNLGETVDSDYDGEKYHNNLGDNTNIGGVIGQATNDTTINNTQAYIGAQIYYIDLGNVNVGIIVGKVGDYITAQNKEDKFANNFYNEDNTFVNDKKVTACIGGGNTVIDNGLAYVYKDFVTTGDENVGGKTVMDVSIKDIVLTKLYNDFGFEIDVVNGKNVYNKGIGISSSLIQIKEIAQIEKIDKYVNQYYILVGDIDMANYTTPIALHKIFSGLFEGNNNIFNNFASNLNSFDNNKFGFIGNLNGTVQNVVFKDLKIEVSSDISGEFSFGLISAVSYANANVNNIIAIGHINLDIPNANAIVGGLVGSANGGVIRNIFNMANIKVNANDLSLGGLVGYINNTILAKYTNNENVEVDDAIFSLARVEGYVSGRIEVGAIYGEGICQEANSALNKIFAMESNTYANGTKKVDVADGKNVYTTFGNNVMRSEMVSDGNLFEEVFVTSKLYPLAGKVSSSNVGSTSENPFIITNEEQFAYIDNALFAYYNIAEDIYFNNFKTIGDGMCFTGYINGKNATSGNAEDGSVSALHNVTDSLFYNNEGTISDLSLDVNCNMIVDEDTTFGAIAVINSGIIKNVIVSGNINITASSQNYAITVSGFIGQENGGTIDASDEDKIQNSISSVDIKVYNSNTVYVGGYIGKQTGNTSMSFVIGQGSITTYDCQNVTMGWLIGRKEGNVDIDLSKIEDYTYTLAVIDTINNKDINIPTEELGTPINYFGTGVQS